jgi:SAM-dependent methyltransferase
MNAHLPDDHVSVRYYDSDYPGASPESFDPTLVELGLAYDVDRFLELAGEAAGPVLDLCCGTGRVTLPLARKGFRVTGVDVSEGMLQRFRGKLAHEEPAVAERITLVQGDVSRLDLGDQRFALATLAFNSLLCLTSFADQCATLVAVARHLEAGGRIAIDAMNAMHLPVHGDPVPKPFATRRDPQTGHQYMRFSAIGPMEADQVQELFGWYDEIGTDGLVRRTPYSLHWRPIFRYELALMLERAGFEIESVEGGHRHEPFTAWSQKMFVVARRR